MVKEKLEKAEEKEEKASEKHEKKHAVKEEKIEGQKESVAIVELEKEVVAQEKKEFEQAEPQLVEEVPQRRKKKKKGKEKPVWIEYKPKEIEEMVVSLANQGHSASEIGTILKEQNGVLDIMQATKKPVLQILTEGGIKQEIPEDLLFLIKKAVALNTHLKKNKKDASAIRGYEMSVSKIRKLTRYYIRKKRLPTDWRYTIEKASLLVK